MGGSPKARLAQLREVISDINKTVQAPSFVSIVTFRSITLVLDQRCPDVLSSLLKLNQCSLAVRFYAVWTLALLVDGSKGFR